MTTDRILRGDPFQAPKRIKTEAIAERYLAARNRVMAYALASVDFDPIDYLPCQRFGLEEVEA
jgi:hypothetical protein